MLENLNNVDWSKIRHAYGAAADVPILLRNLASGTSEERERALWELHGNIWHQGTVYEATAYAVPFLLELIREEAPDQLAILGLLVLIATGSSYLQVHRTYMKNWTRENQEQLQLETQWVSAAKAAVSAGTGLLLDLLSSPNTKIREMSSYLLGWLTKTDDGAVDSVDVIERILGPDAS